MHDITYLTAVVTIFSVLFSSVAIVFCAIVYYQSKRKDKNNG